MKISYAITVCNELEEIKRLVDFLLPNKRIQDEIVILYDNKNGDERVLDYLLPLNIKPNVQTWRGLWFEGHFGEWKNLLTSYCTGDYIFQIDADEMIGIDLIESLPLILEANPEVDVFLTPRINTVEGLTQQYIDQWRWNVNDKGWVNFPDYQWRIYKNSPDIKWKNKVHEVLDGYKTTALLPAEELFCLLHPKTIDRQVKQNNYYDTL
jgi:ankyrin repeat protein